jgi:hypothetical protein
LVCFVRARTRVRNAGRVDAALRGAEQTDRHVRA